MRRIPDPYTPDTAEPPLIQPSAASLSLIGGLTAPGRDDFARAYAERARSLGLTYLSTDGPRAIPVAMPPIVEARARTDHRASIARVVTRSLAEVARHALDGDLGSQLAEGLLSELAPLERAIVEKRYREIDRLATVRVDMMVDPAGVDRVLEINATIPAMQGYSDIAARAFVEVALERLGARSSASADAEDVLDANGSNADDLLDSLLACGLQGEAADHPAAARRADGILQDADLPASRRLDGVLQAAGGAPSVALLHRPMDSQLGELRYLARRFRHRGVDARTVSTDELRLDPTGRASFDGWLPDLIYRHVFAQRAEADSDLASLLGNPGFHRLFNPVAPHLEQKSMLACLSYLGTNPAEAARLGLDAAALGVAQAHLPWTRRLVEGPSTDRSGGAIGELLDWVGARPRSLVLKKSWDFGGKGVFLGSNWDGESSRLRASKRFGAALEWKGLVEACAADGGWVVQEQVPLESRRLWVATAEGAMEADVFVDVSAYTNLGVEPAPRGGVCRASSSPIVNIQSGGGVVPLLSAEAVARLEAALR